MPQAAPIKIDHRAQQAWLQGQAFARQGRWHDAASRFEKAARLQPRDALYFVNLADARLKSGEAEAALAAATAARRADPDNALALALQSNALVTLNRRGELVLLLEAAPQALLSPELWAALVMSLLATGHSQRALERGLQALTLHPAVAALHLCLGEALGALKMKREAAQCLRTALLLGVGPRQPALEDLAAFYERETCQWEDQPARLAALHAALPEGAAVEANPFVHAVLLDDPLVQLRTALAHSRFVAQQLRPLPPVPTPVASTGRALRVGYLSSDFHGHATAYLTAELFERHDRRRVSPVLYSLGPDDGSAMRERLRHAGDRFVDLRDQAAIEAARRIRADGIDILVDLKGYTQGACPAVLAHRPAPVQVAWLGFPGTCGAPWIDYVVGDPWVTPMEHAAHFSEKIAQLPGCYQSNDGARPAPRPPTRAQAGLPEGALVLCAFNQLYKLSAEVFDTWCALLRELPEAVLWLLEWTAGTAQTLRQAAAERGVNPQRLIFAPSLPQQAHLDRVGCADLFLDTWPCNAHTTASDMLWAGVPVVTLSGQTFASRVAGSLLHAVGTPELICHDVAGYRSLVRALAHDPVRRQALRDRLVAARSASPLFSGSHFAEQLETLYERMWQRAAAGLAPEHLPA